MRYIPDHDFHIHSTISPCCSDENQTPENILKYAKENNYKKICLTNHFWDENIFSPNVWHTHERFDYITKVLPLPKSDEVDFLFGAEADMDYLMTVGVSEEHFDAFDFITVSTTHLQIPGYTVEKELSKPEDAAKLWVDRMNTLIKTKLPWGKVGVSHLTTGHILEEKTIDALKLIKNVEMYDIFKRCAEMGIGIELNSKAIDIHSENADVFLNPYRIAKECGCKFYLGSDSHSLQGFVGVKQIFEDIVTVLDLKETDKFLIS